MPRDLADVLHHLLPEAGPPPSAAVGPARPTAAGRLPVLAVPLGDDDSVRAGFVWNLAVEVLREGAHAALVAPRCDAGGTLWPKPDARPLGAEVVHAEGDDLESLAATAAHAAARAPAGSAGLVLVRVPPRSLLAPGADAGILAWTLLLCSTEPRDLLECYGLTKLIRRLAPAARIGVTIHGSHRRGEARAAYERVAEVASRRLGVTPESYGLLVGDVQVYRALLAHRPIGLVQPQSPAARSLHDVAALLLQDGREVAVG